MAILEILGREPAAAQLVGQLLAGYPDLEIGLLICVIRVRDDFDVGLKAMFRMRGETDRILVGDGLARGKYESLGLGTEFAMTVGAMQHCRKIRNQYAHCQWHTHNAPVITFTALEEMAMRNETFTNFLSLPQFKIDVPLLQEQRRYFDYTDSSFRWLHEETYLRLGKTSRNPFQKPVQLKQPDLYIP